MSDLHPFGPKPSIVLGGLGSAGSATLRGLGGLGENRCHAQTLGMGRRGLG